MHDHATKKANKLLPKIWHLKYADRLKTCKLPTIHYRRIREDMIETYKILSGKYDLSAIPNLTTSPTLTTRGNDLRLQKNRARYDLCKFFLLIELSICGTVCLMTLCMQNLLTHLNPDWINSGLIRK